MTAHEFYPAPGSGGRACVLCGRSLAAHDDNPTFEIAEAERRLDRAARRPDARDLYHGNRFRTRPGDDR